MGKFVLLLKNPDSFISVEVEFGDGEGQLSFNMMKESKPASRKREVTNKKIQDHIEIDWLKRFTLFLKNWIPAEDHIQYEF